jgi:hypothetical protein
MSCGNATTEDTAASSVRAWALTIVAVVGMDVKMLEKCSRDRWLCVDEVMSKPMDWRFWEIYILMLLSFVVQRRIDRFDDHPIVVEQLSVVVFPALAYAWLSRSESRSVRGLVETRWQ